MQMLSLDHYVIGDSLRKADFLQLCVDSEDMDKDDFLESVYFIDEDFGETKSKGASPSGKGKRPVEGHHSRGPGGSSRGNAIPLDDDDEHEEQTWEVPVARALGLASGADVKPEEIREGSDMRGSSGSTALHN
jgi:hypothetical protein